MSMYIGYINDATAQIERSCREIRECASKLVESAPSASTNAGSREIVAMQETLDVLKGVGDTKISISIIEKWLRQLQAWLERWCTLAGDFLPERWR